MLIKTVLLFVAGITIGVPVLVLADHGNASWSSHGKTPALILQPVNVIENSPGHLAILHAAAAWNDTGFARFVVAPPVATDPGFTEPPSGYLHVIRVFNGQQCCFTAMSIEHGRIQGAQVFLNLCDECSGLNFAVAHELGHVLMGNAHSATEGQSIMGFGPYTFGSCPGPHDLEVLAGMYPKNKGAFPAVPLGYVYQRGGVDCFAL